MMIDTWFGDTDAPTLGFLHLPEGAVARGGVVICPPLGYDQVLGYRTMRYFGQQLADSGLAALRFDYLGEGDASGATASSDAVELWMRTIEQAVDYLRASGVQQVTLVGLRSGSLVAAAAAERLADLRGVVMWDPELSGKRFIRRQRSLYELTIEANAPKHDDRETLVSLALHNDTVAWLSAREITPATIEASGLDHLVLTRLADAALPASTRLAQSTVATLDHRSVPGQEEFLEAPSALATMPLDTIAAMVEWIGARTPGPAAPVTPTVRTEARVASAADGTDVVERLHRVGPDELFAIETVRTDTDRDDELGVVVLQPGAAEHRVGPGRFQPIAARELARRGYRVVRFDRRITGDSTTVEVGEPSLIFAEEWVDDAVHLVEALGSDRLALAGLCAGGWVSARMTERIPTRLTVLMSPNYFKTTGLKPGQYSELSRVDLAGGSFVRRLKTRVREHVPSWMWRLLAGLQVFHDPAVLLEAPTRNPDSTVVLLLTPEDRENFEGHHGPAAVERLQRRGADARVTSYPFGDHSLFGESVRTAMMADLLDLVEETLPAPAAASRS